DYAAIQDFWTIKFWLAFHIQLMIEGGFWHAIRRKQQWLLTCDYIHVLFCRVHFIGFLRLFAEYSARQLKNGAYCTIYAIKNTRLVRIFYCSEHAAYCFWCLRRFRPATCSRTDVRSTRDWARSRLTSSVASAFSFRARSWAAFASASLISSAWSASSTNTLRVSLATSITPPFVAKCSIRKSGSR